MTSSRAPATWKHLCHEVRPASTTKRPLPVSMLSRRLLWPAAGLALLAIGLWETRHGTGWGSLVAAAAGCAFAEAARIEKATMPSGGELWLFSRRNAVFLALPFALGGVWTAYLIAILVYAALSFFIVQRVRHSSPELTRS